MAASAPKLEGLPLRLQAHDSSDRKLRQQLERLDPDATDLAYRIRDTLVMYGDGKTSEQQALRIVLTKRN